MLVDDSAIGTYKGSRIGLGGWVSPPELSAPAQMPPTGVSARAQTLQGRSEQGDSLTVEQPKETFFQSGHAEAEPLFRGFQQHGEKKNEPQPQQHRTDRQQTGRHSPDPKHSESGFFERLFGGFGNSGELLGMLTGLLGKDFKFDLPSVLNMLTSGGGIAGLFGELRKNAQQAEQSVNSESYKRVN